MRQKQGLLWPKALLLGWQEEEVDRLTVRPWCTLKAHEASHASSACSTMRLNARSAPPGLAEPGWHCHGLAAPLVESAVPPESANAASHP